MSFLRFRRKFVGGTVAPSNMALRLGSLAITVQGEVGGGPGSPFYYGGPDLGFLVPTLYIAPTTRGTGSGTSEANAMAATTAFGLTHSPGTVIGVLPGIYTRAGTSSKFFPAWRILGNGTASNPIIVVAKYSAIDLAGKAPGARWTTTDLATVFAHANRSEFRHTGQTDNNGNGTGGPAFGSSFSPVNAYQYWIGLCVDEAQAHPREDSGPVVLWACTGCKILRSVIYGRPAPWNPSIPYDNHNGIRCEDFTSGAECSDNVIYGFLSSTGGAGSTHNHCGIQRYAHDSVTSGLRLFHNFIFGCHTGIFLKDEPVFMTDEIARYNILDNNVQGMDIGNCNPGSTDSYVEYNLFTGTGESGLAGQQGNGNRVHIRYNTMYLGATGPDVSAGFLGHFFGTGCDFTGNIVYGTNGNLMYDAQFRTTAIVPADYNCYFSASGFRGRYNGASYSGTGSTALNTWRSNTSQDQHSLFTDPLFTSPGGYNFAPQAGSPVLTAAQDGGIIGYTRSGVTPGPRYV